MRKIIICPLLIFFASFSFSQQIKPQGTITEKDYYKKSVNQNNTATILLIGGTGLMVTGLLMPKGEAENCYQDICSYKNGKMRSGLFIVGGITSLSSIPFFRWSKMNRSIVRSLSLKSENLTYPYKQKVVNTSFTALSLKYNF